VRQPASEQKQAEEEGELSEELVLLLAPGWLLLQSARAPSCVLALLACLLLAGWGGAAGGMAVAALLLARALTLSGCGGGQARGEAGQGLPATS